MCLLVLFFFVFGAFRNCLCFQLIGRHLDRRWWRSSVTSLDAVFPVGDGTFSFCCV